MVFLGEQRFLAIALPASGEGIYDGISPLTQTISLFFVQATLIMAFCTVFGLAGHYLRSPKVIFEIIAGIILGPSALCRNNWFADAVFPAASLSYLQLVANIGLTFYLFIVGIELDTKLLMTHATKTAGIALAGMVVPFCLGIAISQTVMDNLQSDMNTSYTSFFVFIGTAMSITAFPVLARILKEGGLIYTKPGAMTMGAAALNDAIAWCLLALAISVANGGNMNTTGYIFGTIVGFTLFQLFVIKPFMEYLVEYAESNNVTIITKNLFSFVICMLFMSAWFTELIGLDSIFGAFIFGLTIPRGSHLYRQCREYIEEFVLTFTLPLYFAISGLKTDITTINTGEQGAMIVLVCVIATVGKVFGAGVAAIATGNNLRESGAIAFLMNTRGLVELIVLNVGLSAGILNVRTFSVMVIMCLFTTFIAAPIVSFIYPIEYRKQINGEGAEVIPGEGIELIKKDFTEEDALLGLPTTTNRIAVVVDHLPMMQPIVQTLAYFLPHAIGSQLSVTAMHFIEATKTHRDEFLGLNPEGRLIRVDEEPTDLFAAYRVMEDPAAKKPEMLLISGFCKANSVNVNAFRIEGDAIEYPTELKSIAANNDASLICLPFRGRSDFFRHLFWSSLQSSPAPVLLLLPVIPQKFASEMDPTELRNRSGSLFGNSLNDSYRAAEVKGDEESASGHQTLFTNQPLQVLPLHRRGSVTNKFQKIDCAGLDYHEVVVLLTGKHADLVVLSLLPRLAENAVNKVTVMKPKDFASFNKAILEALEEAKRLSQNQKNVVFVDIPSISTDYDGLYHDTNEVPYDLLVCSFVEPQPADPVAISSRLTRSNTMKGANLVDMVLRGGAEADPVEMRLQAGMPAQYAYSNLVYPELGMIGSKIYEGSHAKASLVLIVHERLKIQGRASVVSERTDLTQAIELQPASAV